MSKADSADLIAAAVTAVPGVAALHAGMFGEIATYLPGHRVTGIRSTADGVTEVHVTLTYGASVRDTAARVRDAASAVLGGGIVDVTVEDIVAPTADNSASDADQPR